eukprot:2978115-Rhodomonas_salina.3
MSVQPRPTECGWKLWRRLLREPAVTRPGPRLIGRVRVRGLPSAARFDLFHPASAERGKRIVDVEPCLTVMQTRAERARAACARRWRANARIRRELARLRPDPVQTLPQRSRSDRVCGQWTQVIVAVHGLKHEADGRPRGFIVEFVDPWQQQTLCQDFASRTRGC